MGKLTCLRCNATAEGTTFDEADEKIDHSWKSSRKCAGDPRQLVWSGSKPKAIVETIKVTPKKSVVKTTKKTVGRK
jgi:hypothetical protein